MSQYIFIRKNMLPNKMYSQLLRPLFSNVFNSEFPKPAETQDFLLVQYTGSQDPDQPDPLNLNLQGRYPGNFVFNKH